VEGRLAGRPFVWPVRVQHKGWTMDHVVTMVEDREAKKKLT
jgi:hypothetical protein